MTISQKRSIINNQVGRAWFVLYLILGNYIADDLHPFITAGWFAFIVVVAVVITLSSRWGDLKKIKLLLEQNDNKLYVAELVAHNAVGALSNAALILTVIWIVFGLLPARVVAQSGPIIAAFIGVVMLIYISIEIKKATARL